MEKILPHQVVAAFLLLLGQPTWLKRRKGPHGSFWMGRDTVVRKATAGWWYEGGACRLHLEPADVDDARAVAALLELEVSVHPVRDWDLDVVAYPTQWPALLPWLVTLVQAHETEEPGRVTAPPLPLVVERPGAVDAPLEVSDVWAAEAYKAMKVYKYDGYVAWEAR